MLIYLDYVKLILVKYATLFGLYKIQFFQPNQNKDILNYISNLLLFVGDILIFIPISNKTKLSRVIHI